MNVLCEFEDKNNNGVVDGTEGWDYHMYFGFKKIADVKTDAREEFYITDHLGTVNAVLNDSAKTTQQYAFDPYGNMEYAQGRSDNKYLFTGKEYDAESGVFYFGARYYDSKAGRWLGRDSQEQFFSSYVYCANNPLGYVDPDGNQVVPSIQLEAAINATEQAMKEPVVAAWNGGKLLVQEFNERMHPPVSKALESMRKTNDAVNYSSLGTMIAIPNPYSLMVNGASDAVGITIAATQWVINDITLDDLGVAVVSYTIAAGSGKGLIDKGLNATGRSAMSKAAYKEGVVLTGDINLVKEIVINGTTESVVIPSVDISSFGASDNTKTNVVK